MDAPFGLFEAQASQGLAQGLSVAKFEMADDELSELAWVRHCLEA